ncbi:RHS repeat-associated core domain-containing protein [Ensifer adhaerens]|uniref:RHS repeat-associated core domain-containing protein n=1 Tax=Ensifer adhaerens TaxID=106592 RepID=UPI001319D441|nr:RHS repeat-associated core domain-containing protein [Ensifer adhaerens]
MIFRFSHSLVGRILSLTALSAFVLTGQEPYFSDYAFASDRLGLNYLPETNDVLTVELTRNQPRGGFHGVEVASVDPVSLEGDRKQVALIRCIQLKESTRPSRFMNVTRDCDAYSVLTTSPVAISIYYDLDGLGDVIDSDNISVLEAGEEIASLDAMRPLSSHLDRTNTRTTATLQRQAGIYMAGAIKLVDQASAPVRQTDPQLLAALHKENPVRMLNMVGPPEATAQGELVLPYELEFPGSRENFAPNISIRYSSGGGYGPLGEGWKLQVPVISVETRWGTPVFAKDYETETYLLNGEQLIPETGTAYTGSPADPLQLIPMPMRTTNLRPRKKGQARFVLRRDDELTRVIRHGDEPTNYWWEVWSEKPKNGHPRVMYFGNAPGRVPDTLKNRGEAAPSGQPAEMGYATVVGANRSSNILNERSQIEWNLAREVDNNGNVIDYEWASDPAADWNGLTAVQSEKYLQRVLYTSTLATEETILKCRELPGSSGCRREWALYEMLFRWRAPDDVYTRTSARSGGLLLSRRQLDSIDLRARQLTSDGADRPHLGRALRWSCEPSVTRYSFSYRREFGVSDSEAGHGRLFLERITRKTGGDPRLFQARRTTAKTCEWPDGAGGQWAHQFQTRFAYDLTTDRPWRKSGEIRLANAAPLQQAAPFGLISDVRGALLGGSAGQAKGPLSTNLLGSNFVSSSAASAYLGINFFNRGKTNSFGVKSDYSKRTGYREATLLVDVNSDGLNDLIYATGGGYRAVLGKIDPSGQIGFEDADVGVTAPPGFVTFSREPFHASSGTAYEAHFLGTFFAGYHSNASTVQDIYLSDVNGDGRIDVVSKGVVFFNNSRGREISFSTSQDTPYIDDRDYGGLSDKARISALTELSKSVAETTASAPADEDDPRVDAVRYWRAPFTGDIIIRGDIIFAPPAEPSDLRGVPHDPDPELDRILREDRRDGLLFTIELNGSRNWSGEGVVRRCFAHQFGRQGEQRKLITPAPEGAVGNTIPLESCVSDLNTAAGPLPVDLPSGAGPDDGLLLSVRAGDVVYFRTHVIDNAQDDVIEFEPRIDYLRLFRSLRGDGFPASPSLVFGLGGTGQTPSEAALLASLSNASSKCMSLPYVDGAGAEASAPESQWSLCDPWGRSLARYRMSEEADEFTNGSGFMAAPFDGRFQVRGTLSKPESRLPGEIWLATIPRELSDPQRPLDCQSLSEGTLGDDRIGWHRVLSFPAAEQQDLRPTGASNIKVHRGDSICSFVSFVDPGAEPVEGAPSRSIAWPEDLSQFRWNDDKLALVFDRRLVYDYSGSEEQPGEPDLPLDDCPVPRSSPERVKNPGDSTSDNPNDWGPPTEINFTSRCTRTEEVHWMTTRFVSQPSEVFLAKSSSNSAERLPSDFAKLELPSSDLECSSNKELREYRVRLDARSILTRAESQLRRPGQMAGSGQSFAQRRTFLWAEEMVDGVFSRRLLDLQPVTFSRTEPVDETTTRTVWPIPVTDDLLVQLPADHALQTAGEPQRITVQQFWQRPPENGEPPRTDAYIPASVTPEEEGDDGRRLIATSMVAYRFCAKPGTKVEVTSIVEGAESPKNAPQTVSWKRERALTQAGACSADGICPLAHTAIRLAQWNGSSATGTSFYDQNFVRRPSEIAAASYRGWGRFTLTTGFKEPAIADNGSTADPRPLSADKADIYDAPAKLPVVRRFNVISDRYLEPEDPFSKKDKDSARAEIQRCGQSDAATAKCKRDLLAQRRVSPVVLDYKSAGRASSIVSTDIVAETQPGAREFLAAQNWTYCQDNAILREATTNERASAREVYSLQPAIIEKTGLEVTTPHLCAVGPDSGAWLSGTFQSSSRIGRKNLVEPSRTYFETAIAAERQELSDDGRVDIQPLIVKVLPKVSSSKTSGTAAEAWVGLSRTSSRADADADLIDLNGDGFPDQIQRDKAWISDPAGRLACQVEGVWSASTACLKDGEERPTGQVAAGVPFTRTSDARTNSLSIPFTSPKTFTRGVESASARMAGKQVLASRDPSWGTGFGLDFGNGKNARISDLVDLNGDGLPDWYANGSVRLNTGLGFSQTATSWQGGFIEDRSASLGLSASVGYGTSDQEYGGGFSASAGMSRQKNTLVDLNGDGLTDVLRVSGSRVDAGINNGHGFDSLPGPIAALERDLDALGQSESDNVSASGYFTLSPCIPVPWGCIFLVINPGASTSASLTRQAVSLRDANADGLPDILVGGGLKIGSAMRLLFDNDRASVFSNPYSYFGSLTGVYLPTNPDAYASSAGRPNYSITYGRTAPGPDDPNSRLVVSSITSDDGVVLDDARSDQVRRTCFAYSGGRFDRFERQFLGFARSTTVEGCTSETAGLTGIQGSEFAATLSGIRRIERSFSTGSIFETGLVLRESITDEATPRAVAGHGAPTRVTQNTYALVDVGRSTSRQNYCYVLADSSGVMQPVLPRGEGGLIDFPRQLEAGLSSDCQTLPTADRRPRRLAPVLIQTVLTTGEGGPSTLKTALQYRYDSLARVVQVCDLGRLGLQGATDDLCSRARYDNNLQLSFIHGATGGGTMAYDLRDRIIEVILTSGAAGNRLKRTSAAYDDRTGDLVTVCQFQNLAAPGDPCRELKHVPSTAAELEAARAARVAQHLYERDDRGNLIRSISPVAADGYFIARGFQYDDLMSLVEVKTTTDYCRTAIAGETPGRCLGGTTSRYDTYESWSGDIDWRRAVATTDCDINRNGVHRVLDAVGRVLSVSASWNVPLGEAARKCASPEMTEAETWRALATYEYKVAAAPQDIAWTAPKVRVKRTVDARLYKTTGDTMVHVGSRELLSEIFVDQFGRDVISLTESDICVPAAETPEGAECEARSKFAVDGLTKYDALDRPVASHFPVALADLPSFEQSTLAALPPASSSFSSTILDGFDRPLAVRLPDQNGYAFGYDVAQAGSVSLVHRTIARDSRCIPSVTDRDARGNIVAVQEFSHTGTRNGYGKHAIGSSHDPGAFASIAANGWVSAIEQGGGQQVTRCREGDPGADGLISSPLRDPAERQTTGVTRLTSSYAYDAMSRLVAVDLPPEEGVSGTVANLTSGQKIQIAYDGLGHRNAIADPDRGFEYLSYDLASNLICSRSGPRIPAASGFDEALSAFRSEASRTQSNADRLAGEDMCLTPTNSRFVDRTVRQRFVFDRLTLREYVRPVPVDGQRKNIAFEFGSANDTANNRAGRQTLVRDVTGEEEILNYSAIGYPVATQKSFVALRRRGHSSDAVPVATLREDNLYDAWGIIARTTLTGKVNGLRSDGRSDPSPARQLDVRQSSWYRYSPNGQTAELLVGIPCSRESDQPGEWATEVPDCRDVSPPIRFLADAAFDERGNNVRSAFGHGVITRNQFDRNSNRLTSSTSRMGVPCIEFGFGDDCSKTAPPIFFQNVSYQYDSGGFLTAYENSPAYADPCEGGQCGPISMQHAAIQGLLITGSSNRFAYDEVGRIKSNRKSLRSFERNPAYTTFGDRELVSMRPSQFQIEEEFRFSDNHLLRGLKRSVRTGWASGGLGSAATTTIEHIYSGGRPNAPDLSTIRKPQRPYREEQVFDQDSRGRLRQVNCEGCLEREPETTRRTPDRSFGWDPDDTLVEVTVQTAPTERQDTEERRRTAYFNEVSQSYDFLGNRTLKRSRTLKIRPSGGQVRGPFSDTLYLNERLSVTRQPGQLPEGLYHIVNGARKVGAKWLGGEGLFSYHAQIATQSISDVVYARGDDPSTARIHKQLEYAPFGEVVVGREATLSQASRDPGSKSRLDRPELRFNGKEYDPESGLSYFGSRFYDQRLALWLSPDPVLDSYLDGELNEGVFQARNLAAYSFGWGNPTAFVDPDGQFIQLAVLVPVAIAAGRAMLMEAAESTAMQSVEIAAGSRSELDFKEIGKDVLFATATLGVNKITKLEKTAVFMAKVSKKVEWHHFVPAFRGPLAKGDKKYVARMTNYLRENFDIDIEKFAGFVDKAKHRAGHADKGLVNEFIDKFARIQPDFAQWPKDKQEKWLKRTGEAVSKKYGIELIDK